MKLNRVEKLLMNNPIRRLAQSSYEAPLLMKMGGQLQGACVLEVGCGQGFGTEVILKQFGAAKVTAFDLDEEMVAIARKRLSPFAQRVTLRVGDATAIPEADNSFDAVVDFGIFHHIPDWQQAVAEIVRVLRPEGRFYFEEVTRQALERWLYRTFLDHPLENRFTAQEFVAALELRGLDVRPRVRERLFGDFVFGVGIKGSTGGEG